jgi:hypothetical protein
VAFNVVGVLAALAVLGPAARALERLLPARPAESANRGERHSVPIVEPLDPEPEAVPAATQA